MRIVSAMFAMTAGLWLVSYVGQIPKAAKPTRTIVPMDPVGLLPRPEVVKGELIIKFKPDIAVQEGLAGTDDVRTNQALAAAGVSALRKVFPVLSERMRPRLDRFFTAVLDGDREEFEAARRLSTDPSIEYAEPRFTRSLDFVPNDPSYASPQSGYFNRFQAAQAWDVVRSDSNASGIIPRADRVVIATVDGGTMWTHQDLQGNLWINTLEDVNGNGLFDNSPSPGGDLDGIDQDGNGYVDDVVGWNFTNNNPDPRGNGGTPNSADHGTQTASNFGAATHNALGMAGSAFNPQLMPVCAASATGDNLIAYGYEGIVYAAENGADVINCSWGGTGYSQFEQDVITAVTDLGSLVVAAAGNGGPDNVGDRNDLLQHYPSGYRGVLAVGAINQLSDTKAGFSNYGVTVPVYAPGVSILGCLDQTGGSSYGSSSGTSFSSPLTAGLAGLVKTLHPSWTPHQIRMQIRTTADSIDAANPSYSGLMGHGRVNFRRAVTESHPGLDMVAYSAVTTRGENYVFLAGDTVRAVLTLSNVLFASASDLNVTASSSDASVTVLQNPSPVANVASGETIELSPIVLSVNSSLTISKNVFIKVSLSSNGGADKDAVGFAMTVYPALPNWSLQTAVPTAANLYSVKVVSASVIWAGGTGGTVVRTTDGGENWVDVSSSSIQGDVYNITALDGTTAFVTTTPSSTYIYRTTDGGTSWQQVFAQTGGFIDAIQMFDATNGLAVGDPVGGKWTVLKTTDGGASWYRIASEPVQAGTEAGWNNSMCWIGSTHGWFGTNNSRIYRTTDGGATWSSASTTAANSYSVSFADVTNGLAGFSAATINRSTNGGAGWFTAAPPSSSGAIYVAAAPNSTYFWHVDGSNNMRKSTQGGASGSWTTQYLPPVSGGINHLMFADTVDGWAVTGSGEILKSGTYSAAPTITSIPETSAAVGQPYSYDAGAAGFPVPTYYLILSPSGMTIDTVSGVVSWTPASQGIVDVTVRAVNALGMDEQSFTIDVGPSTGIDANAGDRPKRFALEQNFPNPFNPLTTIRYSLPRETHVVLKIYNLLGQEVRTLVDGREHPGIKVAVWDGRDDHGRTVSSGLYIYRLAAEGFRQSRKMILMK
jgi:photosystem II stability/assembly factor-like uncharacterized protein